MSRKHTLIALVLLVIFILNNSTASQAARADYRRVAHRIHRKNPDDPTFDDPGQGTGTKSQNWGNGIAIRELQGLSREQAMNSAVDVNLRLCATPGPSNWWAPFRDGKGSGRFTLTPDEGSSRRWPRAATQTLATMTCFRRRCRD